MRETKRDAYIRDIPEGQQALVLGIVTEYTRQNGLPFTKTIVEAMNGRICDIDEMLPDYMLLGTARNYFRYVLNMCDMDDLIAVWDERCMNCVLYHDEYIYHMDEFNECMQNENPIDIVYWSNRGAFDPHDEYFCILQDEHMNIDKIESYDRAGITYAMNMADLVDWMVSNPLKIPDRPVFNKYIRNTDVLDWFDL